MCIIVFLYPTFSRSYFILVDIHAYFLVEPGKKAKLKTNGYQLFMKDSGVSVEQFQK